MKWICAALLVLGCIAAPAHADGHITYTVEPFDFDGAGMTMTVTQNQFGGRYCPCVKIPYPADGMHNQQGVDAIAKIPFKPGDTLMGFSLGDQVISLFLSQHQLPAGVKVLLAGDTLAQNDKFGAAGIPANVANPVTMVVNEYDGWSDSPTKTTSAGYSLAISNASAGTGRLHYYANANPDDPANVITRQGNITAVLIPTQHLPQNDWMRPWFASMADSLDAAQRPQIDTAYNRPGSSPAKRAAAAAQQVPQPNPPWPAKPEPAAAQ